MDLKKIAKGIFGRRENTLHESYKKISYSQSGEDLIIDYIFRLRNILTPTYLDLGSNHPYSLNNTFFFYKSKSRGVNIDANPIQIKLFNLERNDDVNVNIGVGIKKGYLDFYIFDYDPLSTFSKFECDKLIQEGRVLVRTELIQIKTISEIIKEYFNDVYPDFVSIYVEGFDEEIINSMDFSKSKPKVICLETVEYTSNGTGKKRQSLIQNVTKLGFTVYADTNINTIFVENNFWFNT